MAKRIAITPPNVMAAQAALSKEVATSLRASLPLDGFSRWSDLQQFIPLSHETIRQRELAGRFPRRQKLSERCNVWSNREIHKWMADPVNYRADTLEEVQ